MVYGLQISGKYLEIFSLGEMKECEAGKLHITEKPMKPRLCHSPPQKTYWVQRVVEEVKGEVKECKAGKVSTPEEHTWCLD